MKSIAIVADTFFPSNSSGAVQLTDLAREMKKREVDVTVFVPDSKIENAIVIDTLEGIKVVRIKTLKTKDVRFARRFVAEILLSPIMRLRVIREGVDVKFFDLIIWYSPSIFLGYFAGFLKKKSGCKSYLILRDIFPQWARDMGLIKNPLVFHLLNFFACYQYKVADVIGVQSPGNIKIVSEELDSNAANRIEVLHNWLSDDCNDCCSINIAKTKLARRKIFVYSGNMGVAQGMEPFIELAVRLRCRDDIGFLFIGRGTEFKRLESICRDKKLDNVLFFDEIPASEIPALYKQCVAGLVSLDVKHRSHNIPGKFISYMKCGLPVLAKVNPGNDLIEIVESNKVGLCCNRDDEVVLEKNAIALLDMIEESDKVQKNCRSLYLKLFRPRAAVDRILSLISEE